VTKFDVHLSKAFVGMDLLTSISVVYPGSLKIVTKTHEDLGFS